MHRHVLGAACDAMPSVENDLLHTQPARSVISWLSFLFKTKTNKRWQCKKEKKKTASDRVAESTMLLIKAIVCRYGVDSYDIYDNAFERSIPKKNPFIAMMEMAHTCSKEQPS